MHRLLALLALLTTSLTPVAALHCEMGAAGAEHARADHAQHQGAPAAHHAHAVPNAPAPSGSQGAPTDADERAAPDVPDRHPDCRLVMACGMSMLRSVHPAVNRGPLPTAPGPEQAPTLALTIATPPAEPPPPRRSV